MTDAPNPDAWRSTIRRRILIVAVLFTAWAAGIEARLIYLQVYRHDDYVIKAVRQHMRTLPLPAIRGDIVDRDNRVLATSADVETIYAVPSEIDDPQETTAALCRKLDDCTADFKAALLDRLSAVVIDPTGKAVKRPFQYVKRHVTPEEANAVRALKLDGIGFMPESHRFYPNRELLGPTLGYVGVDNVGLGGIERSYDSLIRGTDGKAVIVTDAKKHAFDRVERPPSAGASIELTIDSVLQHDVERELEAGIAENSADGGVAIVMDPWTGEILAMASEPDFNPNVYGKVDPEKRKNRAVEEIYEPGSTFKTVTASAALDEGVLTPETLIECAPGYIEIGSRRVHDVHTYGTLSFTDVIVKSSNVGAIRTGFKVGPERLERFVRRFGFGTRSLQELPGESAGMVWSKLSDDALASVSMGYQVGVTPMQMVTAVSSIANGGMLMRPHLVRAMIRNGVRHPLAPEALHRTIKADTAAELTTIMEGVVERGTGKPARIDGYTIAGKTGTAAKLINGEYSKQKYFSSFIGFMPSRKPAIAVLVMVDAPSAGPYYGGLVAAPIFKRIGEIAVRHLGIPRSINPETPVVMARNIPPSATRPVTFVSPASLDGNGGQDGVMPDLRGLSARAAVRTLARLGLVPRMKGSGFVAEQQPAAGAPIDTTSPVALRLERQPPPPPADTDAAQP